MDPNQNVTPQNATPRVPQPSAASSTPNQVKKTAAVKYAAGVTVASYKPAILDLNGDNLTLTYADTKEPIFNTLVSSLPKKSAIGSFNLTPDKMSFKVDGKKYNIAFASSAEGEDWMKTLDLTKPGSKKNTSALSKTLKILLAFVILLIVLGAIASATRK